MSVDESTFADVGGYNGERHMVGGLEFLSDMADSWARMVDGGSRGWARPHPPMAFCALTWWMPPRSVVVIEGDEGFLFLHLVRQVAIGRDSGYLFPVRLVVHAATCAARVDHMGPRLAGFEPGFMAPLPAGICKMLDWLWFGFKMRTADRRVWQSGPVRTLDPSGEIVDNGRFLRFLTFNRSAYACDCFGGHFGVRDVVEHFGDRDVAQGHAVSRTQENHVNGGLPVARAISEDVVDPVRVGGVGPIRQIVVANHAVLAGDDDSASTATDSDGEADVISIHS